MFIDNLEKVLHNIFINALRELIRDKKAKHTQDSPKIEKIMNRHLFQKISRVMTVGTPLIECPIQPSKNDESPLPREEKKPDITLRLVDYETCRRLDYHIECKRLDKPPAQYCRYYITNGVVRFIDPQYGYGCFCDLGFMIGYIQDLTFDKAFKAVNFYALGNNIPPLKIINEDNEVSISTLEHILERQQEFSKFRLKHYWAEV